MTPTKDGLTVLDLAASKRAHENLKSKEFLRPRMSLELAHGSMIESQSSNAHENSRYRVALCSLCFAFIVDPNGRCVFVHPLLSV